MPISTIRSLSGVLIFVASGVAGGLAGLAATVVLLGGLFVRGYFAVPVPVALQGDQVKIKVPLIAKEAISADVRRFRFGLPSPDHVLGLPIGQHLYVSATIGDEPVVRVYTPVTSDATDRGYFDLMLKVYYKGVHPKFPEGGKMSQYLDALPLGATIDVRGPTGHVQYAGNGTFHITERKQPVVTKRARRIGMIAGGTGITPMLQLINEIVRNTTDATEMHLLFANQSEADILLRKELDALAASNRLKLWYTVDRPPAEWAFSAGFIDEAMVRAHMPAAGPDTLILLCGPPPMIKFACLPSLEKAGYSTDHIISF